MSIMAELPVLCLNHSASNEYMLCYQSQLCDYSVSEKREIKYQKGIESS